MKQIPFNPEADGTCRTVKANYARMSRANFLRRGGMGLRPWRCGEMDSAAEPPSTLTAGIVRGGIVRVVGSVWRSKQNGKVYDAEGIAPCICVGHHAGVEPKIIEYE